MKNKAIYSSFFLKSIFGVSLMILVYITFVSYKHSVALTDSTELVAHSYKVHLELDQLFTCLKDAETGQRGYIITHDTVFLRPFYGAHEKVNTSFAILKNLTANNLKQQNNLDSLYRLINLRFTILEKSLKMVSVPVYDKEELNINLLKGKNVMDDIRVQINKMVELELEYMKEHQKNYENEISFTPVFTFVLLIFSVFIFIFSYFKINKDLEHLKKSTAHLLVSTESFKHAEEIGEFSSWQWYLETNKLIYSDNQYRLLGCEPHSFDPTIEKFLEFVHPDDRHFITESGESVMKENKPVTIFYRVIRKDGELRYFKSIGKLLTDLKGKKIILCINSDITEQHLSNVSLEERNNELEQSNKELASFNHIASHDLQEPLRIIQTLISRIIDKEFTTLSDKGKEYFTRIQASANRMRVLINDLLLFSRTSKLEKVFEVTELSNLLEDAKQELSVLIEEKNAVINDVKLPALKVIPFQIQQLFSNLISNSLKYCKENVPPVITISCNLVNGKDYPALKSDSKKKYYKISFEDNGLGFEQEHQENIFNFFFRLHHIADYPGTGIGLSICKKIVENHGGIIIAVGKTGIGSVFTVLLPK